MGAVLASLPVPIAVAVVTALVTSLLGSWQARNDRLAALRLETYRDLVIRAQRWSTSLAAANTAELNGEDFSGPLAEWGRNDDQLREQMNVLPIVARKGAVDRIERDYAAMVEAVMQIDTDASDWDSQTEPVQRAQRAMSTFITRVTREARREIRRSRV